VVKGGIYIMGDPIKTMLRYKAWEKHGLTQEEWMNLTSMEREELTRSLRVPRKILVSCVTCNKKVERQKHGKTLLPTYYYCDEHYKEFRKGRIKVYERMEQEAGLRKAYTKNYKERGVLRKILRLRGSL
jgi:hypothetical protein